MTQRSTYDRALDLLAFRARSVEELRRKLVQKGEDAGEIARVIDRLRDQNLLDDADFARQFARTRFLAASASRFRIVQELGRKGVARAIAEQAVGDVQEADGVDPAVAIQRVAEKKWRLLAKLDAFTRRRRLYAFLARRGFNPDEIKSVMNTLGEEIES